MTTQLERAANALFPSTGNRVGNIKFFRGQNRGATAEQLAEQFNRAEAQVRAGSEVVTTEKIDGELTS